MSQPLPNKIKTAQYTNRLLDSGVIQLTGEEKVTYLQGQITADVNKLTQYNSLLGSHCDFKGKVWSVFYSFLWQNSILLITHKSVLDKSFSELKKYGVLPTKPTTGK
jgi:folate-binding Fe-S cluster repair protein YgfZ